MVYQQLGLLKQANQESQSIKRLVGMDCRCGNGSDSPTYFELREDGQSSGFEVQYRSRPCRLTVGMTMRGESLVNSRFDGI